MSNDALTWAWQARLDSGPKFVLVALADHGSDHSGEDWTCFPSVKRLCDRTGLSVPTIERHLKALEKAGWLSRKRRRRPDGTLGIYDYHLHRDEAVRETLKAERNQAPAPGGAGEEPPIKLMGGQGAEPPINLPPTTHQNDGQPPIKLMGHEPSVEPSDNPHTERGRAREPGSEKFEAGFKAYPESGRARTDAPKARAAWAKAADAVGAEALIAAVIAYVEGDADLRTGDYGAPPFERWLAGERWRFWMARTAARADEANAVRAVWPGPADVRAAFVAARGEAWARSWLDPAGWREADRTVLARTGVACRTLGEVRAVMREHELSVEISKGEG